MCVERLPIARRLAEPRDVRDGQARRIRDLATAAGDQLTQRCLSTLSGLGQLARAPTVALESTAFGGGDDQVALQPGGIALELAERAGHVRSPPRLLSEGVESGAQHVDPLGPDTIDASSAFTGQITAALDLGPDPDDPTSHVGAAGIEREAGAELADDRVAQSHGFDERDGAVPGGVETPPDQLRHPLPRDDIDPARVPGGLELGQAPCHGLAERLREHHVGRVVLGLRRRERRGVQTRELAGRSVEPAGQRGEVLEEFALRRGLAQPPGSDGRPLRETRAHRPYSAAGGDASPNTPSQRS
ncbi:hypothetical protein ACH61_03072 [Rathayibacter tanaceti]|uniref:Uncharacterized protein n=1 Tax=Rathayibacter tanaceti TaxID=1671680 RepID=A0A162F6X8_9MICO|nr:hypothetical protein ACH61_03072 [Rathayibacter tanaceti]